MLDEIIQFLGIVNWIDGIIIIGSLVILGVLIVIILLLIFSTKQNKKLK